MPSRGFVSLVGAGPGDPELITLRALKRLRSAEVVVYDRLIDPSLLNEAPDTAERVFVGKARGQAVMSQRAIEQTLVDRARAGKRVVRLKGGDPFVFGRGGEEVTALAEAGIPYEVVPGITSAVSVPASAGIPVTHRDCASCLTVVTGHEDPDKDVGSVDWSWLARGEGTIVVLMGLHRLPDICERLIAGGRSPSTPAAVISHGTTSQQRELFASLWELPDRVRRAALPSPAVVVVGEVAAFPESIAGLAVVLPQAV